MAARLGLGDEPVEEAPQGTKEVEDFLAPLLPCNFRWTSKIQTVQLDDLPAATPQEIEEFEARMDLLPPINFLWWVEIQATSLVELQQALQDVFPEAHP